MTGEVRFNIEDYSNIERLLNDAAQYIAAGCIAAKAVGSELDYEPSAAARHIEGVGGVTVEDAIGGVFASLCSAADMLALARRQLSEGRA